VSRVEVIDNKVFAVCVKCKRDIYLVVKVKRELDYWTKVDKEMIPMEVYCQECIPESEWKLVKK